MGNLANGKVLNLNLIGKDGNAYELLGEFKSQARKENWPKEEIDAVVNEAMSGDYDHLLTILAAHTNFDEVDVEEEFEMEEEDI